jgi:hypothetical protein
MARNMQAMIARDLAEIVIEEVADPRSRLRVETDRWIAETMLDGSPASSAMHMHHTGA